MADLLNNGLFIAFAGQFFAVFIFFIRNESRLTKVETTLYHLERELKDIKNHASWNVSK